MVLVLPALEWIDLVNGWNTRHGEGAKDQRKRLKFL
jgi:hypothetical protein